MIDKNLFIQDLKQVFTVLQELKVNEKMIKQLIDKYNLTEENLNLTNEELEEVKTYVDTIKDFIVQNDNTTEIGGNLEIDGKLEVNSETTFNSNVEIKAPLKTTSSTEFNGTNTFNNDVTITGEMHLPSASSLIFEDGSSVGGSKLYRHTIILFDETETTQLTFTVVSSKNKTDFSSDFEFVTNVLYYGAIGCQMSYSPMKIWIVSDIASSYIDISPLDGSTLMSISENNLLTRILTQEL